MGELGEISLECEAFYLSVNECLEFLESVSTLIWSISPLMNADQMKDFRTTLSNESDYLAKHFQFLRDKTARYQRGEAIVFRLSVKTFWYFVDWSARLQSIEEEKATIF